MTLPRALLENTCSSGTQWDTKEQNHRTHEDSRNVLHIPGQIHVEVKYLKAHIENFRSRDRFC